MSKAVKAFLIVWLLRNLVFCALLEFPLYKYSLFVGDKIALISTLLH